MISTTLGAFDWRTLRLTRNEALRMLIAGATWGVAVSASLTGMTLWNCGMICQHDLIVTTALSVAAGIIAIGPLAAYGRR
jgi:integral membrane sensor domain MASE1